MEQSSSVITCDDCTRDLLNETRVVPASKILDDNHHMGSWLTEWINKVISSVDECNDGEHYSLQYLVKEQSVCKHICSNCYYKKSRVVEEKSSKKHVDSGLDLEEKDQNLAMTQGNEEEDGAENKTLEKLDEENVVPEYTSSDKKLSLSQYIESDSRNRERSNLSTFSQQLPAQTIVSLSNVEAPPASVTDDTHANDSTMSGTIVEEAASSMHGTYLTLGESSKSFSEQAKDPENVPSTFHSRFFSSLKQAFSKPFLSRHQQRNEDDLEVQSVVPGSSSREDLSHSREEEESKLHVRPRPHRDMSLRNALHNQRRDGNTHNQDAFRQVVPVFDAGVHVRKPVRQQPQRGSSLRRFFRNPFGYWTEEDPSKENDSETEEYTQKPVRHQSHGVSTLTRFFRNPFRHRTDGDPLEESISDSDTEKNVKKPVIHQSHGASESSLTHFYPFRHREGEVVSEGNESSKPKGLLSDDTQPAFHLFDSEGGGIDSDEVYKKKLFELISNMEASDDLATNRQWLMEAQTCLIYHYTQAKDFSEIQVNVLLDTLSSISSSLPDKEYFQLTKALLSLVSEKQYDPIPSNHPQPSLVASFLRGLLYVYSIKDGHQKDACIANCLKMIFQNEDGLFHDEELVRMVRTFLEAATWCASSLVSTFAAKSVTFDLQQLKQLLHLIQTFQVPVFTTKECLQMSSPLQMIDAVQHFINTRSTKGLQQIIDELSQSKLLEEDLLKKIEECLSSSKLSSENDVNDYVAETREALNSVANGAEPVLADNVVTVLRNLSSAVNKSMKFVPQLPQLASLCILILSHKQKTNRLLEVLTGEGKSCIIAMFAACLGLLGKKVDIVTSSQLLAKRDAENWKEFFEIFGLTAACNTETKELLSLEPSKADAKRQEIYKHTVVYGTVCSFSADILRDEFEMRQIRCDRGFQAAIIDEVDILMLDEGVQFTYLSRRAPVLRHIEPILGMIWSAVRQNSPLLTEDGGVLFAGVAKHFHDAIFDDMDTKQALLRLQQLTSKLENATELANTVKAIADAEDVKTMNDTVECLQVEDMILLINLLNANEIVNVKAYILGENSTLRQVSESVNESDQSSQVHELAVLLRDKGMMSSLHSQEELADGVENMIKSQCDLSHQNEHLHTVDGTLYFPDDVEFLDEAVSKCLDPLRVLVKLCNVSDDIAKPAMEAQDQEERNKAMENFTTKDMLSLIYHLNSNGVFHTDIVAYTLDCDGKLMQSTCESATESENRPKILILVLGKGKLQPIYHQGEVQIDGSLADLYAIDGTVYTPEKPDFFDKVLSGCIDPLLVLAKLGIVQEDRVKHVMDARNEKENEQALEDFGTQDIIKTFDLLNKSGASHSVTVYTLNEDGKLVRAGESENPNSISFLVEGNGILQQLHTPKAVNLSQEEGLYTEDGSEYYRGAPSSPKEVFTEFLDPLQILHLMVTADIAKEKAKNVLDAKDQDSREKAMEMFKANDIVRLLGYLEEHLPCTFAAYTSTADQALLPVHDPPPPPPQYKSKDVHPFLVLDHGIICFLHEAQGDHANGGMSTPDGTTLIPGPHELFFNALLKCVDTAQFIQLLVTTHFSGQFLTYIKDVFSPETPHSKETSIQGLPYLEDYLRFKPIVYDISGHIMYHSESTTDSKSKAATKPDSQILLLENGKLCRLSTKEKVAVPLFLKDFVVNQLPTYIESAFTAHLLTENREYLVSGDGNILPIDFQNSGVIEENKRWGGGLQQMLEMKHHLHLSPIAIITNFKSHVGFFKHYTALYGLSGTIGSDSECEVLRDLYEFQPCRIPTNRLRLLYEREPILVEGDRDNWLEEIHCVLKDATSPKEFLTPDLSGSAALVLCEDIRTANEIRDYLSKKGQNTILYTRNDLNVSELFSEETVRESGDIIIATNLAGRGTDIKVTDSVNQSGGLFCLVTFLPKNRRVELQAFGRTARQGCPGSVQYVLPASSLPLDPKSGCDMSTVRVFREQVEASRLKHMVKNDVQQVLLREKLFDKHCAFLKSVLDMDAISQRKDQQLVIDAINENWGQWLQTKQLEIELQRESLLEELDSVQNKRRPPQGLSLSDPIPACNFHSLVKFGNHCLFGDQSEPIKTGADEAFHLYTKAIKMESKFTMIAYHNRACCTLTAAKTGYIDLSISDLKKATELLDVYTIEVTFVHQCAGQKATAENVLLRQMEVRMQLLHHFKKKMDETVDKLKEMKKNGDTPLVVPTSILQFIPEADIVTNDELYGLKLLGLEISFTVKKKPTFSWSAFAVFLLGIVQIVAGACLTVLSAGTLSSVGMGLIAEGVSDCIDGAWGMITGDFDLKDWAISKACSIALSIACGGVGKFIAKGAKAAVKAGKAAKGFRSGIKAIASSAKATAKKGVNIVVKDVKVMGTVAKDTWGKTMVNTMKTTGKLVGKELMSQGALYVLSKLENMAIEEIFEKIGQSVASHVESQLLESFTSSGEKDLGRVVDSKFVSKDHQRLATLEKSAYDEFASISDEVVSALTRNNSTTIEEVTTTFRDKVLPGLSAHLKGKAAVVSGVITLAFVTESIAETTEQLTCLSLEFQPEMVKHCKARFQGSDEIQDYSAIDELEHVKKLKEKLAKHTAETFGEAVTSVLQQNLSWILNRGLSETVNNVAAHHINSKLKVEGTKEQIVAAQSANYLRSMPPSVVELEPHQAAVMKSHAENILHPDNLGTLAELRVAAEKYDCKVVILGEDGRRNCSLQSATSQNHGKETPEIVLVHTPPDGPHQKGHYDVMVDGKVVSVRSEGNSCMYEAFAQGINHARQGETADAKTVRRAVSDEISKNPELWHDHFERRAQLKQMKGGLQHLLEGGSVAYSHTQGFKGKAAWYSHMDCFLVKEWINNPQNDAEYYKWHEKLKKAPGPGLVAGDNVGGTGLHRCHRLSEKSIQEMVHDAIINKNVDNVRLLRKHLLPDIADVGNGKSLFHGDPLAEKAFVATYMQGNLGSAYTSQVADVVKIIDAWHSGTLGPDDYQRLVRHLSNSPVNVSYGDGNANSSIQHHMDYNPGTPRSEGIRKAFKSKPGFYSPKKEGDYWITSFFSGKQSFK